MLQNNKTVEWDHPCSTGRKGHPWVRNPAEGSTNLKAIMLMIQYDLLQVDPEPILTLAQMAGTKVMMPTFRTAETLFCKDWSYPIRLEGGLDIVRGPRHLAITRPIIVVLLPNCRIKNMLNDWQQASVLIVGKPVILAEIALQKEL